MSNSMEFPLKRSISPFESHHSDRASCLLMMHEALKLLPETYYQSPHWDHEPTQQERNSEAEYLESTEVAAEQIEKLAANIFMALTGKRVISVQKNFPDEPVEQIAKPRTKAAESARRAREEKCQERTKAFENSMSWRPEED